MSQRVSTLKARPPSLSLVTVTSLEKNGKTNPFSNLVERYRTDGLGFFNNKNLANFYDSPNGTPTIVIDQGSDPELFKRMDEERHTNDEDNKSVMSNKSVNSKHFIEYLTPPSKHRTKKRMHSPPSECGSSISTISSIGSQRLHKSVSEASFRSKHSQQKDKDPDTQSIGGCSIGQSNDFSLGTHYVDDKMKDRLLNFMSVIYAMVIIMVGAIVCIKDLELKIHYTNNAFIIITNCLGFVWLAFLHWDIHRYKKWAIEYLKPKSDRNSFTPPDTGLNFDDDISITTAVIFNSLAPKPRRTDDSNASNVSPFESAYRFLHGKHSGNFYLKCGITVFCFGSIVHMGIQIFMNIFYIIEYDTACEDLMIIFVLSIRSIFSFYQLFMVFKYSNILINRYRAVARFALMHLVGTAIASWFNTIINEAVDDYVHKVKAMNETEMDTIIFKESIEHLMYCLEHSIINKQSMDAIPYLYPFTIEYNIILASVWYMIWTNIGKEHHNSHLHHLREEISENELGEEEIVYHSSVAINADCHASNRGLFGGLSTLLLTCITIVIFFTTIHDNKNKEIGVTIYSAQIGVLTIICCIIIPLAYKQMRRLDIVSGENLDNSSTGMDDLLVLLPIPFYLLHYILSIAAMFHTESNPDNEMNSNTIFLIIIYILTIVQVLIQSPFIVDGIRRCSNTKQNRFTKPGRELVTFALVLNVTLWILNTFELKSVDKYQGLQDYYGKLTWMVISHTTLPVMLFYRYHSSVCLSDIWKYAYEKDHTHIGQM